MASLSQSMSANKAANARRDRTLDAATALPNEQIVACDIAPPTDAVFVTLDPSSSFGL